MMKGIVADYFTTDFKTAVIITVCLLLASFLSLSYWIKRLHPWPLYEESTMGASFSALKEATSGDPKQVLNDALNSLEALAAVKMDDFYQKTENQADSFLLPIDKITGKFLFMQAKAETNTTGLQQQVSGLISDLAGGHWADALASTAADIISDLLGSSSASVAERSS